MQRWLEQLSQFDFEIVHRPGTKHRNADFLSRIAHGETIICRQCKMPLGDNPSDKIGAEGTKGAEEVTPDDAVKNKDDGLLIGALFDTDYDSEEEEHHDIEPIRPNTIRTPSPRVNRKRGRKANRPTSAKQKPEPENELVAYKLQEYQEQDKDVLCAS